MSTRTRKIVQEAVRGAGSALEAEQRIKTEFPGAQVLVEKRHDQFDIHLKVGGERSLDVHVS
jgi:hypothetical protein